MEKNRSYGPSVRQGGAQYTHDRGIGAGTNGYGINSELPFSKATPEYPSAPNKPMINGDGMDNFHDERFAGSPTATPLGPQSNVGKDAIKTGDSGDTAEKSF